MTAMVPDERSPVDALKPALAVVIIARNEESTIAQCIASARSVLEGKEDDIVVVDSASTDNTATVASTCGARVIRLRPAVFLRPAIGRFVGYAKTVAPWILFIDGDCYLHPHWFEKAAAALRVDPSLAGVAGSSEAVRRDEGGSLVSLGDQYTDVQYDEPEYLSGSALYRRSAIRDAGGMNPWLYGSEEIELGARLRKAGYRLRRLRDPMTQHFPKARRETVAEIIRRTRRRYPIGMGQLVRHTLACDLPIQRAWISISRHMLFLALMVAGAVALIACWMLSSWTPIIAWTALTMTGFAIFAIRSRSVRRPSYYFFEWTLTSPLVLWGLLQRPALNKGSTHALMEKILPKDNAA